MRAASAKKQTIFLTLVNTVVRALGLLLRVLLSRALGAELMGVMELAQSVHMLAITPLTSGLPLAVSRMTARAKSRDKMKPLHAALGLARLASALLIPALLLLSPWLARLIGDVRALPSLWFTAPCSLILGYSGAYNGYSNGMEQSALPALSELIEQAARLAISFALLRLLRKLTAPWLAAIPVAATMLAELIGLAFVLCALKLPRASEREARSWRKPVLRLAAPTTLSRLVQTLLRSLTAMLIPLQLQRTGLPAAEATARLGMYNGMVLPILMLPCMFTSALSMVALPKLAKAEDDPRELRRLLRLCAVACLLVGVACAAICWGTAPFLANVAYRMPELTRLFRLGAPLALLFAASHVAGGVTAALGQQKRAMYGSVLTSVLTLALTAALTAVPTLRLAGVMLAQGVGQALALAWQIGVIVLWARAKRHAK